MALGVLSSDQYTLILGGAVVSIALNSFAFKLVEPLEHRLSSAPIVRALYERHARAIEPPKESLLEDHVVVVGYGHAGKSVLEALVRLEVPCLLVERDLPVAEEAEEEGIPVLVGDAANSEILAHAHLDAARVLVIAGGGEAAAEVIAREARSLAPTLRIVTRADSADGVEALVAAGVNDVVRPELEGGIELMRHTLLDLGYRPRQIQEYANDLRASGYEALGDGARRKRMRAAERMMASLAEVDLHWVEVASGSAVAAATLGALDLRACTGAQAVALRRGEDLELFLGADTVLCPGDHVALMGTDAQLEAAEALFAYSK